MAQYFEPLVLAAVGAASKTLNHQQQMNLLDQTKTLSESALQMLYTAKEAGGNPKVRAGSTPSRAGGGLPKAGLSVGAEEWCSPSPVVCTRVRAVCTPAAGSRITCARVAAVPSLCTPSWCSAPLQQLCLSFPSGHLSTRSLAPGPVTGRPAQSGESPSRSAT